MSGHLTEDGFVVVPDQAEANRLYNKGFAGTPQRGGALRLSLVEAVQLVEDGRLEVTRSVAETTPLPFRDLFESAVATDAGFEIPFFAYRDLRARGLVVKHANRRALAFLVYARGAAPAKGKPAWLADAASERQAVTAASWFGALDEAKDEGAELVFLVVDEEGDVTHYKVEEVTPRGSAPVVDLGVPLAGTFVEDRVFVWGAEAVSALRAPHFIGKPVPDGVQLSLVEAAALIDAGDLEVADFWARAERVQPDLRRRQACYQALRGAGLWVKTGFKFGTHFRVYDAHPDERHAPWIAHAVGADWETTWPEVSRAVRLAHGVRKTMLFSVVDGDAVRHLAVERFRP